MKWPLSIAAVCITLGLANQWMGGSCMATAIPMWIAVAACGAPIARHAFYEVRRWRPGIQTLIAIAVIGAWVIGENLEAAMVVFLFELGSQLEGRAMKKTQSVVQTLFDLYPETATVFRNGVEQIVSTDEIAKEDTVLLHPGDKIPVDGVVTDGRADVRESAITGEAFPVSKSAGSLLYSGSIVESGYLRFTAEKVGDETTIARMLQMMENADEAKTQMQRVLNRFAQYYTPCVVLLAILVYVLTFKPTLALTLLVVACPGALVIATPVSIISGIGSAAKRGMLIKGGESVERVAQVNAIAFDKTGTLTEGNAQVTRITSPTMPAAEFLRLVACAEMPSEHFLGKALVNEAKQSLGEDLPFPDVFEEHPGQGITAKINERTLYIGNPGFLRERGIDIEPGKADPLDQPDVPGQPNSHQTTIYVGERGRLIGWVGIEDTIRHDARALVANLKRMGIEKLLILTGDNAGVAGDVAEKVGIDEVHASLLPADKVRLIQDLQKQGYVVAMVGDGINDAPALAASNAGITLYSGTGIALETADVVLMSNRLSMLSEAIRVCRRTRRNIRENVAFAILVAATLIVGATTGFVLLAPGMLVHEASILLVIVNGMRLLSPARTQRRLPMLSQTHRNQITHG